MSKMTCHVYNSLGDVRLKTFIGEPECGVDFCDQCGDCLYCHGDEMGSNQCEWGHSWVKYEDEPSVKSPTPQRQPRQ